jgi:hypothetical protein
MNKGIRLYIKADTQEILAKLKSSMAKWQLCNEGIKSEKGE